MTRRTLLSALLALLWSGLGVGIEWRALHGEGSFDSMFAHGMLSLPFYALAGVLVWRRARLPYRSMLLSAGAVLLVASIFLLASIPAWLIEARMREAAFAGLAERSAALIAAIERYELEHRAPPPSLEDLVPGYLPEVPGTGLGAYPAYEYHSGEPSRDVYGDRWALVVLAPRGLGAFDKFLYVPGQDYSRARGGLVERMGPWAYLHD